MSHVYSRSGIMNVVILDGTISICITGNMTLSGQIVVRAVLYRNWKAQMAENSNTLPLQEWVKEEVSRRPLNTSSLEEMELRLLS
jgi:hypothetical protein